MIFMPFGVKQDELADPLDLAKEFQEAMRIAQHTTQFQWNTDAIGSVNKLKRGHPVKIYTSDQEGHLYRKPYNSGSYTAAGNDPDLSAPTSTGADDLYHIPYNRGWEEVSDVSISWTSSYPELCFFIFSFQFLRKQTNEFHSDPSILVQPRVQMRLGLDNGMLPGTGPFSTRLLSEPRGMGYARRSMSSTICGMTILPAGAHRATMFAAQVEADVYATEEEQDFVDASAEMEYNLYVAAQTAYLEYPPTTGVCFGNRRLIAITFPRGGELRG